MLKHPPTLASKCFDYQFLVTLYERGQGIPSGGDKKGERKGSGYDQNCNKINVGGFLQFYKSHYKDIQRFLMKILANI